jgi:hypothetical protein
MYRSSDVLDHLKGVCAFLEIVIQHASERRENILLLSSMQERCDV